MQTEIICNTSKQMVSSLSQGALRASSTEARGGTCSAPPPEAPATPQSAAPKASGHEASSAARMRSAQTRCCESARCSVVLEAPKEVMVLESTGKKPAFHAAPAAAVEAENKFTKQQHTVIGNGCLLSNSPEQAATARKSSQALSLRTLSVSVSSPRSTTAAPPPPPPASASPNKAATTAAAMRRASGGEVGRRPSEAAARAAAEATKAEMGSQWRHPEPSASSEV
mmetsp:Transcript_53470/g.173978  ORF Transcript_53470/g.173978 Transcript_53470/m.173978 type:complete len:226 (-) Transcript_53470:4989-5666(-)